MGLPLYLAMTGAEIHCAQSLPDSIAYMACHFSPYSTGLSNLPGDLIPGSLLMVNDRIPIFGHDPGRITQQLREAVEAFSCGGVVLDLQRDGYPEQRKLCQILADALPCPVAVSELYASGVDCPVFLSAPGINCPLEDHIGPYHGREIWLEAALDTKCFTITKDGCSIEPFNVEPPQNSFIDDTLHCRYTVEVTEKAARFRLWRTTDDLQAMIHHAHTLGIAKFIGLYQELSTDNP